MKLDHAVVLTGVADALRDQVAPHVADTFTGDALRMAQSLIRIVALAAEDGVAISVAENAAMRAMFADALALVDDSGLAERLRAAAGSADPGLRSSELKAETGRLRRLLVDLHSWLEEHPGPQTDQLSQAIWGHLREFELARAPRA